MAAVDIVQEGVKHGWVITKTTELVGGVPEVGLGRRGNRRAAMV